jgi:hypothetical protein
MDTNAAMEQYMKFSLQAQQTMIGLLLQQQQGFCEFVKTTQSLPGGQHGQPASAPASSTQPPVGAQHEQPASVSASANPAQPSTGAQHEQPASASASSTQNFAGAQPEQTASGPVDHTQTLNNPQPEQTASAFVDSTQTSSNTQTVVQALAAFTQHPGTSTQTKTQHAHVALPPAATGQPATDNQLGSIIATAAGSTQTFSQPVNHFPAALNAQNTTVAPPVTTQKKSITVPATFDLDKTNTSPFPPEIFDDIVKYLEPKDCVNLAKTCRSCFKTMSEAVGHYMSVSSTAFVQSNSQRGSKKADANIVATLNKWALFTSDFLDAVHHTDDRITHVTIKCRKNQDFLGMDGYAAILATLKQNELRFITQLTIAGRVHISAGHLLFTLSELKDLRSLVVAKVPSIDPAMFLTEVLRWSEGSLTIDFTPIMPENVGGFKQWRNYRHAYFTGLYFAILPLAKKYLPALIAPGSSLYDFMLRTFFGHNGMNPTELARTRVLMSKLFDLVPLSNEGTATVVGADYMDGDEEMEPEEELDVHDKIDEWVSTNHSYVEAAAELVQLIARNWRVKTPRQADVFYCDVHEFIFGMSASEGERHYLQREGRMKQQSSRLMTSRFMMKTQHKSRTSCRLSWSRRLVPRLNSFLFLQLCRSPCL